MKRRFRRDLVVQVEANGWGRAEGHQVPPYILEALTEPIPEEEATGEETWSEILSVRISGAIEDMIEAHTKPLLARIEALESRMEEVSPTLSSRWDTPTPTLAPAVAEGPSAEDVVDFMGAEDRLSVQQGYMTRAAMFRAAIRLIRAHEKPDEPAPPYIDVVFDGPPGPVSGRFVEVEDPQGHSIGVGDWVDRGDGLWALRIPRDRARWA